MSVLNVQQQMPLKVLERTFGKSGVMLWERANGIDLRPVVPYSEQKSLSKEITFEQDTTDVHLLHRILGSLTEQLAYDLRKLGQCTSCITVKLRYSNFDTHTRQISIPASASDHRLIPAVHELFEKLYDRRLLIRLIGVRFSKLLQGQEQLSLFEAWWSSNLLPRQVIAQPDKTHKSGEHLLRSARHDARA